MKKELLVFLKEFYWILKTTKKFKNFNVVYHLDWIHRKEIEAKNHNPFEINWWDWIFGDPKNYHIWYFFLGFIIKKNIRVWKNMALFEICNALDVKNYGSWNTKLLFYLFSERLSGIYSKSLLEKNPAWHNLPPIPFWMGCLFCSKINNTRCIAHLVIVKRKK